MQTIQTRCAIAGGGPAGIMLGYLLARAGIDVVVLEKWPDFFRDFRGDTIHPSTMEVLRELGLLDEFLKLPHSEMQQMAAHVGGREIIAADFRNLKVTTPFVAFMPQWDFLNFISQKGRAYPTFHLMMKTEATDVIFENGRAMGICAQGESEEYEIRADLVIGADGRHSTVREKAGLTLKDLGAPIDVAWFKLTRIDDGTKRSLAYLGAGTGIVLLDRDTYWQCGLIIRKGGFDELKAGGIERLRESIVALVPSLKSVVHEIASFDEVKLLSVSVDHLDTWYREGLICIGDSAHAMSPVGGVGINLAIQDAVASANILIAAFKRGVPTTDDLAAIQKRRMWPARMTQRLQVFLHRRVLARSIQGGEMRVPYFMRILGAVPMLQRLPAYVIGIGFRPEHIE